MQQHLLSSFNLRQGGLLIIGYIDWLLEQQNGQVSAAIVSVIVALSPFPINMCPAKVEAGVYQGWEEKKGSGEKHLLLYLAQLQSSFTSAAVKDFVGVFIPGWLYRMNKNWMNKRQVLLPKWNLCSTVRVLLILRGFIFVLL